MCGKFIFVLEQNAWQNTYVPLSLNNIEKSGKILPGSYQCGLFLNGVWQHFHFILIDWVLLKPPTHRSPTTDQATHRPFTTYPPTHRSLTHRSTDRLLSTFFWNRRPDSKYVLHFIILKNFTYNLIRFYILVWFFDSINLFLSSQEY